LSSSLLSEKKKTTIILLVVLYGRETWFLTLRDEHRLRVFENRVLRIFGPKEDELIGGWRKLHNVELHNLHYSPSVIKTSKTRIGRARSTHEAKRNTYTIVWESQKEKDHQEDQDIGGRIILRRILER
jgi:hypothetical protein